MAPPPPRLKPWWQQPSYPPNPQWLRRFQSQFPWPQEVLEANRLSSTQVHSQATRPAPVYLYNNSSHNPFSPSCLQGPHLRPHYIQPIQEEEDTIQSPPLPLIPSPSTLPCYSPLTAPLKAVCQATARKTRNSKKRPKHKPPLFSVTRQVPVTSSLSNLHSASVKTHPGLRWLLAVLDKQRRTSWDLDPSCTLW